MDRTCSTHVDDDAQKIFYGINEGKCSLERPRRRWEDIKMDIKETGYKFVDWINLTQNRDRWRALVNMAVNHRVIYNSVTYTKRSLVHWEC